MKFLFKPRELQCPYCKQTFFSDYRGDPSVKKSMSDGSNIHCPNCQQISNYNRNADFIFGAGLITAIIGMPIAFNMQSPPVSVTQLAVMATALVVVGSWLRRLKKTNNK